MNEYHFLQGGNEMGALLRSFDWNKTPIGSPDKWPQSLRSAVSIVLGSKFPMLLMWGNSLTQIYNDKHREILGEAGKHPSALGQNAAVCWSEDWGKIGPSILAIKNGREGTWYEDGPSQIFRNGQTEQIFTTSSLGPVAGESGAVEGVLLVCIDTTKSIHARDDLRKSEQRFEAAVKAVQGILWTNNANGEMEGEQPGWEQLTGQTQKEYQLFGWTRAIHPDDVQATVEAWNRAVKSRAAFEFEHRILRKSGEWGTFAVRAVPLLKSDGSIREWVGVHTDITGQRKVENSLIQNEQKFRSFLESTPFPTAVYAGQELRIELANQAIIDVWGKGKEVIGKNFPELLPELETQQVFNQVRTVYGTGIPFHTRDEAIDLFKNGKMSTSYFNYSFTPVLSPTGEVYGVMNTAVDVTDLNLARQKLAASEKRLYNMVMQANVATALFAGREMVLIMANDAMKQLWYIGESVKAQTLPDFQPELRGEPFSRLLNDVFLTGEKFSIEGAPVILKRKGVSETIYVDYSYQALRDELDQVTNILVMGVDVTSQMLAHKKIEEIVATRTEELAEANLKLLHSNAELAQYAYVASHDLQEPLRKIRTFASMLFKEPDTNEENRLIIDKISRSAERMGSLILSLLEFSSLPDENTVLETVELQNVVTMIVEDYELLIKEKQAQISIEQLPKIEASSLQMNQLFYNLIGNALKFIQGDKAPRIHISAKPVRAEEAAVYIKKIQPGIQYHKISVADNGIGFAAEYGAQIFEPFKRLHTRDAFPGSGIGLALCRRIVTIHGGVLFAESTPGSGSTFIILLPTLQLRGKV